MLVPNLLKSASKAWPIASCNNIPEPPAPAAPAPDMGGMGMY